MVPITLYPDDDTSGKSVSHVCVFLHGWMGSHRDWESVVTQMQTRIPCVLVDLPGHGKSAPLPPEATLTFDSVVDALHQRLDRFDEITWVGYSMGGRLALHYALRYPQKIRALVLESCRSAIRDPDERQLRSRLDQSRAQSILRTGLSEFVDRWYEAPLFHSLKQDQTQFRAIVQARKQNHGPSVAQVLRDLSPGLQPDEWEQLPTLEVPVLLLTGEHDPKYPTLMQRLAQEIPNSRFEVIPAAGHNVHLERPNDWFRVVFDFLG